MAEIVEKCYKNPYCDDSAQDKTVTSSGQLHPDFSENIRGVSESLLKKLQSSFSEKNSDDYSIYTGTCGIALLYFHASNNLKRPELLEEGWRVVRAALPRLRGRRVSFLCGDAGPLALGAVLATRLGLGADARTLLRRLVELLPAVVSSESDVPDEVLYGRSGYLFSLLFVNKYIGDGSIEPSVLKQVVAAILRSGQALAAREKHPTPLMYKWHDKHYLGAAHGVAGILYMLLQARSYMSRSELDALVRPSVDFVQTAAFESGNFPSSLGNEADRLVQWCHGAPGMADLFLLAHEVFGQAAHRRCAERCAQLTWERGLLRKGYGVCHGVAGNAFCFLALFNATQDIKYLHRACKFAEWCTTYGKFQSRTPDRPLSLFEGLAGAIYFLVGILDPKNALFPAYCL